MPLNIPGALVFLDSRSTHSTLANSGKLESNAGMSRGDGFTRRSLKVRQNEEWKRCLLDSCGLLAMNKFHIFKLVLSVSNLVIYLL